MQPLRKGRGQHPARICAPTARETLDIVDVEIGQCAAYAFIQPVCERKSRYACDVVANPPGTATPRAARPEIISPMRSVLAADELDIFVLQLLEWNSAEPSCDACGAVG